MTTPWSRRLATGSDEGVDLERMRDSLFLDGPRKSAKLSRFWVLLLLSGAIAAAGVLSDSTATVIGAMIVAPLMTPILGTALAFVLVDGPRLAASMMLVILGTTAVVGIGFLFGLLSPLDIVISQNTQVSGRIHPGLVDLTAALATGTVGAFALIRSDVSDALPGVAIAISLVPPLCVAGLMLESGDVAAGFGALLLFATNVSAIVATGTLVFLVYPVRSTAVRMGLAVGALNGRRLAIVVGALALVTVPLSYGSYTVVREQTARASAIDPVQQWARGESASVLDVEVHDQTVEVRVLTPSRDVDLKALRSRLNEAGLRSWALDVDLAVGRQTLVSPGD